MKKIFFMAFLTPYLAIATSFFGFPGLRGADGFDGPQGQDGQNMTIIVKDSFARTYNTSGQNGANAQNGLWGEDAHACQQPTPKHDVRGIWGGAGGDAGRGGDAGNGGDILVYYTKLSDLKEITLLSYPGQPGRGALGAHGGNGCFCSIYSWRRRVRCGEDTCLRTFHCYDGRQGSRGMNSSDGHRGEMGKAKLISQLTPLSLEHPSYQGNLASTLNKKITLTRHIWSSRTGVRQLFSPQSMLQDQYDFFEKTYSHTFEVLWASHQNRNRYQSLQLEASLSKQGLFHFAYSSGHILNYTIEDNNNIIINEAYTKSELSHFKLEGVVGNLSEAKLVISDLSELLTIGKFQVRMKLKRFALFHRTLFEGLVPESAYTISGNKLEFDLLELVGKSKYLKAGKKIRFVIEVNRIWNGVKLKKSFDETLKISN